MNNWNFNERLSCLKIIIEYFDEHEQFDSIRRQCDESVDNYESLVYIFSIDVNLHGLFEKSALLGERVLTSPVDTSNLFHEVIFEYIKCQNLLATSVTSSQVLAKLCITHMPCKNFQICSLSDLTKFSNHKGLVKLTGIISGFSGLTKYTQSTRYVCSNKECDGHFGNHFIRIHIPGALETQTVRSDFMCTFCGGILEEMISSRILSDKMVAEVLPIEVKGHQGTECLRRMFTQAVPVILRDELVDKIKIGKSFVIIGVCRTDYRDEEITITLEANSITEVKKEEHFYAQLFYIKQRMIKRSMCKQLDVLGDMQESFIACIYHDCNENGWRFLTLIALHFASSVIPLGKVIKLRLLLLISLVLPPQENKLHVLAIGGETEQALAVMNYAKQFSCRSCPTSSTTPLNGTVANNKYHWAPYFIQGGSQLLSSGGICFFGEIGLWKKARKEQLKNALVSNKVMIELAPKYTEGLPQTITFPLDCQNWAIHNTSGLKSQAGSSRSDIFTGCHTGDLSKSFLDAFNVVAFLDHNLSSYDEESDLDYLDFMWREHCCDLEDEEAPLKIEADDFEKYLSIARRQDTEISVEAEILLHSYFSANRLARTTGCGGSDVPPSALTTLTSLSMGISKLLLHNVVTESDAIMAVYLYEEYLTSRCGSSVLNVQPQPDVPSYDIEKFFGTQSDVMMQQFSIRLQQFCTRVKDTITLNTYMKPSNFAFKEE